MDLDELIAAEGLEGRVDEVVEWARGRAAELVPGDLDESFAALLEGRAPAEVPPSTTVRRPRFTPVGDLGLPDIPSAKRAPSAVDTAVAPADEVDDAELELLDEGDLELVDEPGHFEAQAANTREPEWKRALAEAQDESGVRPLPAAIGLVTDAQGDQDALPGGESGLAAESPLNRADDDSDDEAEDDAPARFSDGST